MQRKPLSKMLGKTYILRRATIEEMNRNAWPFKTLVLVSRGKVVALLDDDKVYDEDGNYFDGDE